LNIHQLRKTEYSIESLFVERWSNRSFTDEEISDETLYSFFEAARWAPSGFNAQPWRFIYSKRNDHKWSQFVDLLNDRNKLWAQKAAALVAVVSAKTFDWNGKQVSLSSNSFDTGAACASIAFQAHLSGWSTHAIGGYDRDKTKQVLNIPDDFQLEVILSLGRPGPVAALPEELRPQEKPSDRRPLKDIVAQGGFVWGK